MREEEKIGTNTEVLTGECIGKAKSEAHRGDWRRVATEARRLTTQAPKLAFKGGRKIQNRSAPNKLARTRASIIR